MIPGYKKQNKRIYSSPSEIFCNRKFLAAHFLVTQKAQIFHNDPPANESRHLLFNNPQIANTTKHFIFYHVFKSQT